MEEKKPESTSEEPQEPQKIETVYQKLDGPKIVGEKIDLTQFAPKPGAGAKKKRKRIEKPGGQNNQQGQGNNQNSGNNNNNNQGGYGNWFIQLVICSVSFLFLPRVFNVAVVEINEEEKLKYQQIAKNTIEQTKLVELKLSMKD